LLKLSERAASVMSSLQSNAQNRVEQYEREEGAFGLGERLRRQVEAENSIRREFNRAQAQLTRDLDLGLIEGDEVEQRRQQIREFQEAQLDELRAHYDRMEAIEMDWSLSFQSSIDDAA